MIIKFKYGYKCKEESEGGFLVPVDIANEIIKQMSEGFSTSVDKFCLGKDDDDNKV